VEKKLKRIIRDGNHGSVHKLKWYGCATFQCAKIWCIFQPQRGKNKPDFSIFNRENKTELRVRAIQSLKNLMLSICRIV
jgi:hypothetical protein